MAKPGRKKYPESKRRVLIWCRVLPSTLKFIKGFSKENIGRALDNIAIKHGRETGITASSDPQKRAAS